MKRTRDIQLTEASTFVLFCHCEADVRGWFIYGVCRPVTVALYV